MKTKLFVSVFSLLFAMSSLQAQAGSYSMKCEDFAAAGFSSKDACVKDGRWHVVYENDTASRAVYGSVAALYDHVVAGADVKVIAVNQQLYLNGSALGIFANINEKCQQVYRSNLGARPIYCLSPVRFSNEDINSVSHGSARYGSDGRVVCNAMKSTPGGNACTTDPVALKWLVKY